MVVGGHCCVVLCAVLGNDVIGEKDGQTVTFTRNLKALVC